jgi:molybdate transport system substrate-binding protein
MMQLRIVSSMATRHLLADLAAAFSHIGGPDEVRPTPAASTIEVVSMGGVDAAKRVAAGEPFDGVVLASAAIDRLIAQGHAVAGSRVDIVTSPMAVAVRTGKVLPAIDTEDAVRQAVVSAQTVGYSTGPSGDHLMALFDRWGIAGDVKDRLVQARPGIPVASLVASGEAALGFQQLSELMNVDGVEVVGLLPAAIQGTTTFSGGIARASVQAERVRELLAFMASPAMAEIKRRHGMEPA